MFSFFKVYLIFFILSFSLPGWSQNLYQNLTTNLAQPLTQDEIKKYNMTVFPDGKNLPLGKGSVLQGKTLYKNQCVLCHGENGIEGPAARLVGSDGWFSFSDPLRVLRIEKHPILLISVGALWPHATSIFDYIRRAMPHYAPKSLSNEQSYALTAYLLFMNDIIDESLILDQHSILNINMPARSRSVLAWPE